MKNIFTILIAVILSVLVSSFILKSHSTETKKESAYERVIRTGTLQCGYVIYPPAFEIDQKTGEKRGINHDVAEEWGKKLGIKINWAHEVIYGQHIQDLNTRKIDALCGCDGPLAYHAATQVDYAHPYGYYSLYLYGRKQDIGKYKTLADFNDPKIRFNMLDGDISTTMADDEFPKAGRVSIPASGDATLLVENIVTGKADVVILDTFSAMMVGKSGQKLVRLLPDRLGTFPCAFSVRKGEPELLKMIDQGMDLLNNLDIVKKLAIRDGIDGTFSYPAKPYQE